MIDKKEILKNVSQPEERLFLAKVLDRADFCCRRYEKTFTDFCDPAKLSAALSALGHPQDFNYKVFGGNDDCERNIIGFCPEYDELSNEDFPIKAVEIKANAKFASSVSHRDFLGSVLGLGIDRSKVGDIFVFESSAVVFCMEDIADYVAVNLERVGRNAVKTKAVSLNQVNMPVKEPQEKYTTVSSLRADLIVGEAFNLSRSKAQELIAAEKVFVNWNVLKNGSKPVNEGDMISARGFGRVKINEIKGRTKKDKIGIVLLRFV